MAQQGKESFHRSMALTSTDVYYNLRSKMIVNESMQAYQTARAIGNHSDYKRKFGKKKDNLCQEPIS